MEQYAQVLTFAIPAFLLLIILESILGLAMKKKVLRSFDTIASLSSGMTNTLRDLLKLSVVIISYAWLQKHLALFYIESEFWIYFLCFLGLDFAQYWSHRWNHVINVFWNRHIVHHSSEEFNLACALRQPVSDIIGVFFFLYIPIAIIGIPPDVVAVIAPLHLFAQFWYHTTLINKMGILEYILVTPSHHRVHHAINDEYIDKNYAAIFIVWDKLFGTFQEERTDIPPVYGVKRPVNTWNPLIINYQHFWSLIVDAWRTKSWKDKAKIWFMPTGWRPEDVKAKHPIPTIENVYNMHKYDSDESKALGIWSWFQLSITFLFMYHLLSQFGNFTPSEILSYGAFLFLSIFSYTSLMDKHKAAIFAESLRLGLGLLIFSQTKGWFSINTILPGLAWVVLIYLICSFLITLFFLLKPNKNNAHVNYSTKTKSA